jgi:hypothetical protein
MMSHESERDFGTTALLFSVAPLLGVQLENTGIMLPKHKYGVGGHIRKSQRMVRFRGSSAIYMNVVMSRGIAL